MVAPGRLLAVVSQRDGLFVVRDRKQAVAGAPDGCPPVAVQAQALAPHRHPRRQRLAPSSVVPTKCTTRGTFFEPLSVRKERVKEERRQARAAAIARDLQHKREQRALARKERAAVEQLGRGARGAFHADSDAPQFEKLKGKHYNW